MGLFSFVKDAGAAIFGGKDKDDEPAEPVVKSFANRLRDHDINPEGIYFDRKGSVVKVEGTVPDQDTKEKVVIILGNVQGIDTVDDQLQVAQAGRTTPAGTASTRGADATPEDWSADTYTVQPGDTLGGIAKKLYGSASKYMVIFNANTPMLKDPDKIYPGQVLRIPPQA